MKKTAKKSPAAKKKAKPAVKAAAKKAAKPAPKARAATKPAVRAAAKPNEGAYTPRPIQGIGWAPFRYPAH
jgi:predicted flap endonuclease-1-like 5' DNA nuclease